jgi:hypothetical protein
MSVDAPAHLDAVSDAVSRCGVVLFGLGAKPLSGKGFGIRACARQWWLATRCCAKNGGHPDDGNGMNVAVSRARSGT